MTEMESDFVALQNALDRAEKEIDAEINNME